MSREIDERIVQMQFDNAQFEKGVGTSMGTLDKLKSALNFGDTTKGIENLQNAGRRFSLAGIGDAVDLISGKFTAFEVMAVRTLSNIADSAYRTGTRLIKSLSVDQISAGWGKYGEKTNAVASLISQGKWDMGTIDKQLERLNWFTDETSYNFTDMTKEIGKFTAAGKGLDESVNAMEGIAMWAALSGQNASTASRAMYQISQAMGAGVMRKEDFKSIQNASMDTEEFRKKALAAGVAVGTLKENADGTYTTLVEGTKSATFKISQFAENLTETGWFNDKVMMNVFGQYGAAVEQIYEYAKENDVTASEAIEALGDKVDAFGLKAFKSAQEARTFSDVIDSVKDAVSTGWMNTFEIIFGNYEEAKVLWTDLANEMWDVFAGGAEARNAMLKEWKKDGGREALLNSFWTTWNNVLDVLNLVKDAFHEIFPEMDAKRLVDITKKVESFTEAVKEFLNPKDLRDNKMYEKGLIPDDMTRRLEVASDRMENLSKTFKGVFAVLDLGKQAFSAIFEIFKRVITALIPGFDFFLESTGSIGDWLVNLADAARETDFFGKIIDGVTPVITAFGNAVRWVFEHVSDAIKKVTDKFSPLKKEVGDTAGVVTNAVNPITKVIDFLVTAFNKLKSIISSVFKLGIKPLLESLGNGLKNVFGNLKESFSGLSAGKNGLDVMGASFFVVILKKLWDGFKHLKDAKGTIEGVLESVTDFISGLTNGMNLENTASSLLKLSFAIAILAGSLVILSGVDADKLMFAVMAMAAIMEIMKRFMKTISGIDAGERETGGGILSVFLGNLGLGGSNLGSVALSIVGISAAVLLLATAVKKLSEIETPNLIAGLAALAAILGMIIGTAKLMSKIKDQIAVGSGLLISLAISIRILVGAVEKLGEMSLESLAKGLISVGLLLAGIAIFLNKTKDVDIKGGLSLMGMAVAMVIMAKACEMFGNLDVVSLAKGLGSIGAILAMVWLFVKYVDGEKILSAAGSMLMMSAALLIMAGAIKILSTINTESLMVSMIGLAALLAVIAVAANLLTGTLAGAGSLLVISIAIAVLSGSLMLLSMINFDNLVNALMALAVTIGVITGLAVLMAPAAAAIAMFAGALIVVGLAIAAIGGGLALLSAGLGSLVAMTAISLSSIVNGLKLIIVGFATAIAEAAPAIGQAVVALIDAILSTIVGSLDSILEKGVQIVVTLIDGIASAFPLLVDSVVNLVVQFIDAVASAIDDNSEKLWGAIKRLVGSIIKFILDGLDSLVGWIPGVTGALEGAKDWVDENFSSADTEEAAKEAMAGTPKGIEDATPEAKEAMAKYYHEIFKEDGSIDFERAKEIAAQYGIDIGMILPQSAMEEAKNQEGAMEEIAGLQYDEYVNTLKAKNAEAQPMAQEEFEEYQDYIVGMYKDGSAKEELREEIGTFYYESMEKPLVDAGTDAKEAAEATVAAIPGAVKASAAPSQDDKDALYYDYFTYGGYATEGFYQGASAKMGSLTGIGSKIRDIVGGGTAKQMEEKSPSKLMFRIGAYAIQGLLNGMVSLKDTLSKTSTETTQEAIDPIKDSFGSLQTLLDEGLDTDPTIRPVLDLSEIQNGMGTIDGMFGNRTLSVGQIRSNQSIMSGHMNSVNDKLQSLEDRLGSLEENREYNFTLLTEIDGRQVARSTAVYTREELNRLDRRANRKVGIV